MADDVERLRGMIGDRYVRMRILRRCEGAVEYLAEDRVRKAPVIITVLESGTPYRASTPHGPVLDSGNRGASPYVVSPYVERPPVLAALLEATDEPARDQGWDQFIEAYGDLLLRAARRVAFDPDTSMDAFGYILEHLRKDDHRRLRGFSGGGSDAFSRWLAVVALRLGDDFLRCRYGRWRSGTSDIHRLARRRLVDGIWSHVRPDDLPAGRDTDPEWQCRRRERDQALQAALEEVEETDALLLRLRFDQGLTGREIARTLQLPSPFHVYRRLNRVLAVLRTALRRRGVWDPEP